MRQIKQALHSRSRDETRKGRIETEVGPRLADTDKSEGQEVLEGALEDRVL